MKKDAARDRALKMLVDMANAEELGLRQKDGVVTSIATLACVLGVPGAAVNDLVRDILCAEVREQVDTSVVARWAKRALNLAWSVVVDEMPKGLEAVVRICDACHTARRTVTIAPDLPCVECQPKENVAALQELKDVVPIVRIGIDPYQGSEGHVYFVDAEGRFMSAAINDLRDRARR